MAPDVHADVYNTARGIQQQMNEAKSYQDARMNGWDPNEPTPTWVKGFWGIVLGGIAAFFLWIFMPRGTANKTEELSSYSPPASNEFSASEISKLLQKYSDSPTVYTIAIFAETHNKTVIAIFDVLIREGAKPHDPTTRPIVGDVVVSEGGLERRVIKVNRPEGGRMHEETYTYMSKSQTREATHPNWVKWCQKNKAKVVHVVGKFG